MDDFQINRKQPQEQEQAHLQSQIPRTEDFLLQVRL